ncbi:MAG: metallophosphoesterase [Candidatus Cloacimonadia bacterium]
MTSFPYAFLLAVIIGLFILNYVVYYPIKAVFCKNNKGSVYLRLIFLFMNAFFLWSEIFRRYWKIGWLASIGSIWLGVLSIAFTIMLIDLIIILIFPKIARLATSVSLVLIVLASTAALINSAIPPKIRNIPLYSKKVTPELEGLKVILFSELHLNSNTNQKLLLRKLEMVNELEPDLIIIGGDLIDEPYVSIAHFAPHFKNLKTKYGVYSVAGNHEYYQQIKEYYQFTAEAEINNLLNSNYEPVKGLQIVGITDPTAEKIGDNPPNVDKAFNEVDNNKFTIFISHQPLYYDEAIAKGADLLLSGHTHKGQIPPMTFLVGLRYKYYYGLNKIGDSYQYTTSGVSTWGPPMRLLSDNEIVVFTLHRE